MVYEALEQLLADQYACDPDEIGMNATLDGLNLYDGERSDLCVTLEELYGVPIPEDAIRAFSTVEDIVAYIEDRL